MQIKKAWHKQVFDHKTSFYLMSISLSQAVSLSLSPVTQIVLEVGHLIQTVRISCNVVHILPKLPIRFGRKAVASRAVKEYSNDSGQRAC